MVGGEYVCIWIVSMYACYMYERMFVRMCVCMRMCMYTCYMLRISTCVRGIYLCAWMRMLVWFSHLAGHFDMRIRIWMRTYACIGILFTSSKPLPWACMHGACMHAYTPLSTQYTLYKTRNWKEISLFSLSQTLCLCEQKLLWAARVMIGLKNKTRFFKHATHLVISQFLVLSRPLCRERDGAVLDAVNVLFRILGFFHSLELDHGRRARCVKSVRDMSMLVIHHAWVGLLGKVFSMFYDCLFWGIVTVRGSWLFI